MRAFPGLFWKRARRGVDHYLFVPTVDFPQMEQKNHTHSILIRWVADYFVGSSNRALKLPPRAYLTSSPAALVYRQKPEIVGEKSAFDDLMATQGATVRMSDKLPLILQVHPPFSSGAGSTSSLPALATDNHPVLTPFQHQGHSRTIVGVETLRNGETSAYRPSDLLCRFPACCLCFLSDLPLGFSFVCADLLVFDPGKPLPAHLRDDILESRATSPPAVSVSSSSSVELEEKETDGKSGSKKRSGWSDKIKGSKRQKIKAFFGGREGDLKVFRVRCVTSPGRKKPRLHTLILTWLLSFQYQEFEAQRRLPDPGLRASSGRQASDGTAGARDEEARRR